MAIKDLSGKNAFITGGASGIGLGMAQAFVRAGMKVMIADIWQEHIDQALAMFEERGQRDRVEAIRLDVSDRAAYEAAVVEFEAKLGKLHLLCNNAGLGAGMRIKDTTYKDWDWALGVMIGGAVNGIVNFLPRMIAHGEGGHIVNTSSMSGVLQPAMKGGVTYTTGKAALIGMVEQSRLDLAEDNIGISALIPGPVISNIFKIGRTRPDRFANEDQPAAPRRSIDPDPRWMDPEKVGDMVVEGVRNNALYIFTHGMFREGMQQKFDTMLAALPTAPDDPQLVADLAMFTSNPIYTGAA
ncbi:MAG: short-chain dehydrogenase [Sphingomonas bacterium]|nr:short-chain dehydrogenase [Sphingomonas bacterium]MDB5683424.1 short-chain dehydrogenase [Sphingomonas bacterium]MDB5718282.1 short-chain dehydrogenase [Sphingomonas bacterium]